MGAMGQYVDGLSEAARDRIIEAQVWTSHQLVDGEGGGCLRGHAEGLAALRMEMSVLRKWHRENKEDMKRHIDVKANRLFFTLAGRPALRFNRACDRFGKDRVVKAIKARAARGVTSKAVQEEPSYAPV